MTSEFINCIMNMGSAMFVGLALLALLIGGFVAATGWVRNKISYFKMCSNKERARTFISQEIGECVSDTVKAILFCIALVALVAVILLLTFGLGYLAYLIGFGSCGV